MAEGAKEAGQDAVVGRLNISNKRTSIIASEHNDDNDELTPYFEQFVLGVAVEDDRLFHTGHELDAVDATGTVQFLAADGITTVPAGNGVVGRGLNGVVGYVHMVPRDRAEENDVRAGVFGVGDANAVGVFGRGATGVVGCEQNTARNPTFEAQHKAGVCGRGETGVSGEGLNGEGVLGRGSPGVHGEGVGGPGIGATGVLGTGETGVYGEGAAGVGVSGVSLTDEGQGGSFSSHRRAQVRLVPLQDGTSNPTQLAKGEAGELLVLETRSERERGITVASLWFCTRGGGPGLNPPQWTQIA